MRINKHEREGARTHEGAPAFPQLTAEQRLRRSVLSCLLWEGEFYEDGKSIADRIAGAAAGIEPEKLAALAREARHDFHLRHVPLLLLSELARTGSGQERLVSSAITDVISRADELGELVAIYWRNGKKPLSAQMKKGLAEAFTKFDAYQLAKYDRDAPVRIRDVMFMVHPKPESSAQEEVWKNLANKTLKSADTWEVALSAGKDKRETFTRLLTEGRLGYLALLKNLRGMDAAGVDRGLVGDAIRARKGADKILPFRFVAAALAAPQFEEALDDAMLAAVQALPQFPGRTVLLVDVSGSMNARLSGKSDLRRMQAAAALATLFPGHKTVFSFSSAIKRVASRRGMGGVEAIIKSQPHGGTLLGAAVAEIARTETYERLIVITDEQSQDRVPDLRGRQNYMINVGSYQNGIGYGPWVHIDGFSEAVFRFMAEYEKGFGTYEPGTA